jgi:hypothetical protein
MPSFPIVQMRKCNGREWEKVNTFSGILEARKSLLLLIFLKSQEAERTRGKATFVKKVLIQKR